MFTSCFLICNIAHCSTLPDWPTMAVQALTKRTSQTNVASNMIDFTKEEWMKDINCIAYTPYWIKDIEWIYLECVLHATGATLKDDSMTMYSLGTTNDVVSTTQELFLFVIAHSPYDIPRFKYDFMYTNTCSATFHIAPCESEHKWYILLVSVITILSLFPLISLLFANQYHRNLLYSN